MRNIYDLLCGRVWWCLCESCCVFCCCSCSYLKFSTRKFNLCLFRHNRPQQHSIGEHTRAYIYTYITCIIYIHSCIHLYYHQIARLSCILHLRTHIYAFICTLYFCDFAYLIAVCARVFFRASVSPVCGIFFIAKLVFRLFSDANLMELSAPESQWKQVWLISWDAYAYYIRVVYTKKTYF